MDRIENAFQQAAAFADAFEHEQAIKALIDGGGLGPLLGKGADLIPHLPTLHLFASISLELDDAYELAIEAFPNERGSYVFLAPLLSDPRDALELYTKALSLKEATESPSLNDPSEKQRFVQGSHPTTAQIHCAIAELWITDLCNEQDADAIATEHLALAAMEDPLSAEVAYLQAQLFLNQSNKMAAQVAFERALSLLPINNDQELEIEENQMPSMELVLQIAKLGIELEAYRQSIPLLEWSLELQDDLPDLHYLLGLALLSLPMEDEERVLLGREHLLAAKKANIEEAHEEPSALDGSTVETASFEDMLAHIEELLAASD